MIKKWAPGIRGPFYLFPHWRLENLFQTGAQRFEVNERVVDQGIALGWRPFAPAFGTKQQDRFPRFLDLQGDNAAALFDFVKGASNFVHGILLSIERPDHYT